MLHLVDLLNQEWAKMDWKGKEPPLLIARDAKALYPSLDHLETAEVIRGEILRSNIKVQGTNWKEITKYLIMSSWPSD